MNTMHGYGEYYWNDGRKYIGIYPFDYLKVSITSTKKTVLESTYGTTLVLTSDSGRMENSMEQGNT